MIVAVTAMRVVQVAIHKVVDVIAMRRRRMAAVPAVNMALLMGAALVVRCAPGGIGGADRNCVFVHMIAVRVVQVSIVEIIGVAVVLYSSMATFAAMLVVVVAVVHSVNFAHCLSPLFPLGLTVSSDTPDAVLAHPVHRISVPNYSVQVDFLRIRN